MGRFLQLLRQSVMSRQLNATVLWSEFCTLFWGTWGLQSNSNHPIVHKDLRHWESLCWLFSKQQRNEVSQIYKRERGSSKMGSCVVHVRHLHHLRSVRMTWVGNWRIRFCDFRTVESSPNASFPHAIAYKMIPLYIEIGICTQIETLNHFYHDHYNMHSLHTNAVLAHIMMLTCSKHQLSFHHSAQWIC